MSEQLSSTHYILQGVSMIYIFYCSCTCANLPPPWLASLCLVGLILVLHAVSSLDLDHSASSFGLPRWCEW